MKQHKRHLRERDLAILESVHRYRIGTTRLIAEAVFENATSLKNVSRVLRRLLRRNLLVKKAWDRGLWYYRLTARGCDVIGVAPRTPALLSEQSLPVALAVAFHCMRHGNERFTCQEFAETYPGLWSAGLGSSNYVLADTPAGLKLELLLVDRGGAARRIRSRIRRAVGQRENLPEFGPLMAVGRFRINVLTGTAKQRDKIMRQVEKESLESLEVISTVVPELSDILLLRK